jgi:HSP20 family protein
VDIGEGKDAVWMSVDLPGVDEKSVEVGLHDGVLTIEGNVSLADYEDLQPLYSEYNVGNFERRFRVSNRLDPNGIEARIENGVLYLLLPRAEEARPRTIEVRAG